MSATVEAPPALARLREPFPPEQIGKLPRNLNESGVKSSCRVCGGYHKPAALHLDFVGHAEVTARLLDADPCWTWEPVAEPATKGLPTTVGSMWIALTVAGVTRYGFGSVEGKTGGDAVKEVIGDAIRNAAMRFGVALNLWAKSDLHAAAATRGEAPQTVDAPADPPVDPRAVRAQIALAGKAQGLDPDDLAADFAERNAGVTIATAATEELRVYLAHLQSQPVPA